MPKFILGSALAVLLIVLGVAYFMMPSSSATPTQTQTSSSDQNSQSSTSTSTGTPSGYTMAQVTTHNSAKSCWAAINGKVYDLTNWINQHPGGPERILALCGTDGSAAFNGQHGGQARPASELATFYIGALAK